MSERIEYASDMQTIVSWLRYEYDGLNLLRIDERYEGETPAGLDENDPWRPLNVFIHGPGTIGQIVKGKWYNYYSDGQNPTSCCDSGEYYYFYDALGNVNGVLDSGGHYYRWEMDAFGNDLPSGNSFLDMDQPGPKEHLTGKMFDTITGLYYFAARWYDPQVGRFISRSEIAPVAEEVYVFCHSNPLIFSDSDGLAPDDVGNVMSKLSKDLPIEKAEINDWLRAVERKIRELKPKAANDLRCRQNLQYFQRLKQRLITQRKLATNSRWRAVIKRLIPRWGKIRQPGRAAGMLGKWGMRCFIIAGIALDLLEPMNAGAESRCCLGCGHTYEYGSICECGFHDHNPPPPLDCGDRPCVPQE